MVCVSLILIGGCEKELYEENLISTSKNYSIKQISFKDLDNATKLKVNEKIALVKSFTKKLNKSQQKLEYNEEYDIYIDTDKGIAIDKDGQLYYTFPMYREGETKLENIVFVPNNSNDLETYFVKYDITPEQYNQLSPNETIDLNPEFQKIYATGPDFICMEVQEFEPGLYPACNLPAGHTHGNGQACVPTGTWVTTASTCLWTSGGGGEAAYDNGEGIGGPTSGGHTGTGSNPYIYTGSVGIDPNDLAVKIFVKNLTDEQEDWYVQQSPEIQNSISDYLINNDFSENSIDFLEWMISYLITNPTLTTNNLIKDLEDINWEKFHVDSTDFNSNPCTNLVYSTMKNTRLMAKLLRNFSGTKPIINLDWDIANLGTCSSTNCLNGMTEYTVGSSYVNITLNSSMISNASQIWVAKTMLHELIHAEIIRLLVAQGNGSLIPNQNDFPSLWSAYVANTANPDHEYMANFYITAMVSALQEFCNSAGILTSTEELTAICWSGLHNTTQWNALPLITRQNYSSIWGQNLTAGGCP